jgi:hypothetical protein
LLNFGAFFVSFLLSLGGYSYFGGAGGSGLFFFYKSFKVVGPNFLKNE